MKAIDPIQENTVPSNSRQTFSESQEIAENRKRTTEEPSTAPPVPKKKQSTSKAKKKETTTAPMAAQNGENRIQKPSENSSTTTASSLVEDKIEVIEVHSGEGETTSSGMLTATEKIDELSILLQSRNAIVVSQHEKIRELNEKISCKEAVMQQMKAELEAREKRFLEMLIERDVAKAEKNRAEQKLKEDYQYMGKMKKEVAEKTRKLIKVEKELLDIKAKWGRQNLEDYSKDKAIKELTMKLQCQPDRRYFGWYGLHHDTSDTKTEMKKLKEQLEQIQTLLKAKDQIIESQDARINLLEEVKKQLPKLSPNKQMEMTPQKIQQGFEETVKDIHTESRRYSRRQSKKV